MPRETVKKDSLVLTTIGSVNERVENTELPPSEWSSISGTFPDLTGEQIRIYGKRVLSKYANPIYGIAQFWTPLGYGSGLYQIGGDLDYGKWEIPAQRFPNITFPPSVPFDGGGYTVDDYGNDFGGVTGVTVPNVCEILFNEGATIDTNCRFPLTGAGIVNDNNGGPAGKGTRCSWTDAEFEDTLGPYLTSVIQIIPTYDDLYATGPLPNPFNGTNRVPLGVAPVGTPINSIFTTAPSAGYTLDSLAVQAFGQYFARQLGSATYQNCVLNLTPFLAIFGSTPLSAVFVTLQIQRIVNAAPIGDLDVLIPVDFNIGGNYAAYPIDMRDYMPAKVPLTAYGNGYNASVQATLATITLHYRARICS